MIVPYEDAETIRRNKARYCRFVDEQRWDALAALFTADASLVFRGVDGEVSFASDSVAKWLAKTAELLAGARTLHVASSAELVSITADEVSAIWTMEDHLVFAHPPRAMHGRGRYFETWVRDDGAWRIKALELRRSFLD